MTKECKKARNAVLIPLIVMFSLLIFLSSCGGGKHIPCPAYGKSNTLGNPYSCQRQNG